MNHLLKHTVKSYLCVFLVGIFVGCVCRLADYCPADTLWSFSSIQTLLGFWIITNTVIVLLSSSHLCAGLSSLLYMFGMTLSFYGLQAILGMFLPLFSGGFRRSLFVMFFPSVYPLQLWRRVSYTIGTRTGLSALCFTLCRWRLWAGRPWLSFSIF